MLLGQLAEAVNQLGIQALEAEVLTENRKMLHVLRDCGYPITAWTRRRTRASPPSRHSAGSVEQLQLDRGRHPVASGG